MSYQAKYIGLDEVLEAFNNKAKTPYFSMWCKGTPVVQYQDGDTMEDVIAKITHEIEMCVKRQITLEHELYLHSKKEKQYSRKSDSYAMINFRCFEVPTVSGLSDPHQSYNIYALNQEINKLKSEIAALQTAKVDDEEEEEEEEQNSFISGFNQMLEHPLVVGLINKWIQQPSQAPRNLAGVETETSLEEILKTLFSKGVKIEHLKKLSEMSTDKIQMLISML